MSSFPGTTCLGCAMGWCGKVSWWPLQLSQSSSNPCARTWRTISMANESQYKATKTGTFLVICRIECKSLPPSLAFVINMTYQHDVMSQRNGMSECMVNQSAKPYDAQRQTCCKRWGNNPLALKPPSSNSFPSVLFERRIFPLLRIQTAAPRYSHA